MEAVECLNHLNFDNRDFEDNAINYISENM